jgi:hypothetical protein
MKAANLKIITFITGIDCVKPCLCQNQRSYRIMLMPLAMVLLKSSFPAEHRFDKSSIFTIAALL